jgi:phospholipase/carboxylesterase
MSLAQRVREPAGEPQGALVLNHGRGSDEHDLYGLLDEIDPERRLLGVTTGAPLTGIPPGGRHWYVVERVGYPEPRTFWASYELLARFLDEMLESRGIPWERTVVGGFSQGTVMSYAIALGEGRPSPAGIVALSGFVPTVEGWRAELAGREGLPVLIHHGRHDPMIDVAFARRSRELLEAGRLDVTYHESDAGHWLPPTLLPELRAFVGRAVGAARPTAG